MLISTIRKCEMNWNLYWLLSFQFAISFSETTCAQPNNEPFIMSANTSFNQQKLLVMSFTPIQKHLYLCSKAFQCNKHMFFHEISYHFFYMIIHLNSGTLILLISVFNSSKVLCPYTDLSMLFPRECPISKCFDISSTPYLSHSHEKV